MTTPYRIHKKVLSVQCSFKNRDDSVTEDFYTVLQPVYHFEDVHDESGKVIGKALVVEQGRIKYNGGYYFAQGSPPLYYRFNALRPIASRLLLHEAK